MYSMQTVERRRGEAISERMRRTRLTWSDEERARRHVLAMKRQHRLYQLLKPERSEPEIWAVGAVSATDLERFRSALS